MQVEPQDRAPRSWTSRIGRHAVAGKAVGWQTMVVFHFREGKIAEQWVNRDELEMLIELGVVTAPQGSRQS
jgi:predicted ester cyclase